MASKIITTPVGKLIASASTEGITQLKFYKKDKKEAVDSFSNDEVFDERSMRYLAQLESELDEYFIGERKNFTLPVNPHGTDFQKKVWAALLEMPYGVTCTYAQLSERLKNPGAIRAVANANAKNPVMILIPCHRVNGSKGELRGYAGGLAAKKFLLELESGRRAPRQTVLFFPD